MAALPIELAEGFPTNSTYSEALARCDAEQIVSVVASVLLKARAVDQCGSEPSRLQARQPAEVLTPVAMDGKTVRGTLGPESEGQPKVASAVPMPCTPKSSGAPGCMRIRAIT